MTVPSIFVIIPNWNGKEMLKKCLLSFKENTSHPNCIVIVVDNGSIDGSVEMVEKEFPWVKMIKNRKNMGFSKASNQCIDYALKHGAEYILLLNNDVEIVEKKWLTKMLSFFESDPQIGILGCKLLYSDGRIQSAGGFISLRGVSDGHGEIDRGQYDKVRVADYVIGAALLIKAEIICKIGLLDEGFSPLYFEETDWCLRARFHGYKVIYTPHPTFVHKGGSTTQSIKKEKTAFFFKKNWIRFFLLNFPLTDLIKRVVLYEPRDAIGCVMERNRMGILPFKIRNDAPNNLILIVKAWITNIRNLKDIIIKRKQRFTTKMSKRNIAKSFEISFPRSQIENRQQIKGKLLIVTNELYFHNLRYRLHHILPFLRKNFEIKIVAIVPPLYDVPPERMRSLGARTIIKLHMTKVFKTTPSVLREQDNVLIIRSPLLGSRLRIINIVSEIIGRTIIVAWIMRLKKVYKGFDVCLASPYLAAYSALLTKMPIPIVCEDVDRFEFFEEDIFGKKIIKFIERYCIRNSAEVISAGYNLAESAEAIRGRKVHFIPNGIDLKLFKNKWHRSNIKKDSFAILYVGSIERWSGLEVAIKSLPIVISDFPKVKLIIVGSGNFKYINKLKDLIEKLKIGDRVIFLGPKKYDELPNIMSKCDMGLAIFPKIELMHYAFTYKVIEYMAAGLPIVATNFGDTERIIRKYNCGIFVEYTPESVANGIKKLLKDKQYMLNLAKNGRRFSKEFDLNLLAQKEIQLLAKLINKEKETKRQTESGVIR
jgi:GT2 family glycosyltransferase/glycosyltransferase involved in cell wall biosynthesis